MNMRAALLSLALSLGFIAQAAAAHGVPTRVYHFAYAPEAPRGKVAGARHGSEAPFAFEALRANPAAAPSAADQAMAAKMHAYWVNFARTGDPNGPGLPAWPQFAAPSETLLHFDNEGRAHRRWLSPPALRSDRAERHRSAAGQIKVRA